MNGWSIQKLSKVTEIVNGGTPKTTVPDYWDGNINWITPKDLGQIESIFASDTSRTITELGLKKSSAKEVPPNSVILSTRAPIGHLAINTIPMAFNQGCRGIVPDENLHTKYMYYFLYGSKDLLNKLGTGATFKELSARSLKNIEIPVPPLSEQKRIVVILDEAFESIDQAIANVERNIQNAEELFQSKLNEVFSRSDEGWKIKTIGEACVILMGQSPKGSSYNKDGIGTPLINGPVEFGPKPFSNTIRSKWTTEPKKMCKAGDLILCVRGSTTGRINIAGFDACIGRGVAAVRYKNQEWLNYFIRAKQKYIYDLGSGSTFPNVSGKTLKKIPFPEPPFEVQDRLISQLSSLLSATEKVLSNYKKSLLELEELKKSLLQKAFSGELTANEPMVA